MPCKIPKSHKMRVLEGNADARRMPEDVEIPTSDVPQMPEMVREDRYAFEEWNRLAPSLYDAGLFSHGDVNMLAAYCLEYSRWRKAVEELRIMEERFGPGGAMVIPDERGAVKTNPLMRIIAASSRAMVRYGVEFGLTPAARSKLGNNMAKNNSSIDKVIGKPRG